MNGFFSRFFPSPPGGSTEAALSHEGLGVGWALLLLVILGATAFWLYRSGAPQLSPAKRRLLTALRVAVIAAFLLLLVKPVIVLTLNEPIREQLLVLIDGTQSMQIADRRVADEDLRRAAIAAGLSAPDSALKAGIPSGMEKWRNASRAQMLAAISGNDRLRLWPRLQEKADLFFYSFGKEAHPLGPLQAAAEAGSPVSTDAVKSFMGRIRHTEEVTALGDAVRQVLDENRGQPVAGILVLTDGSNNSGSLPEEIAALAKQDGVPLFLYGVGITTPKDIIVQEVGGPRGAFLKEYVEFAVKVRAPGFAGRTFNLQLKAAGKVVKEQSVTITGDGDNEFKIGFEPQEKGDVPVEASIEAQPEESASDNNAATARLRVLDSKVKVLYVEQEPRWDFRYLLAALQRDRRLAVKCVLFDGDTASEDDPNSPFLKGFPEDRADLISNEIIVLGDVSPDSLGPTRMKLLSEWVGEMGGGLIFLAGPKNNPFRYAGTPLEALLPVEIESGLTAEKWGERSKEPIKLKLTALGELSPLFRLDEKPAENRRIWNSFPGVNWVARVSRARPSAQTFVVDATPAHANREGLMPVIAQHAYGQGQVLYVGIDETYRWRSKVGEKYYARVWNQIIQSFSLERQLGASSRIQLKTDKASYFTGDKVTISGKILSQDFRPVTETSVPGTLRIKKSPDGPAAESAVRLLAVAEQPGQYQLEFEAKEPGYYSFSTILEPEAQLKFEVTEPQVEMGDTAMNAPLLQSMAALSGGQFLREENLNGLPEQVAARSATRPTFKKVELFYSPWWLAALLCLLVIEWLLRRLWQLK